MCGRDKVREKGGGGGQKGERGDQRREREERKIGGKNTDTDPTSRERAATAGIETGTSSPGVARFTD